MRLFKNKNKTTKYHLIGTDLNPIQIKQTGLPVIEYSQQRKRAFGRMFFWDLETVVEYWTLFIKPMLAVLLLICGVLTFWQWDLQRQKINFLHEHCFDNSQFIDTDECVEQLVDL